jgi:hypothetical protein
MGPSSAASPPPEAEPDEQAARVRARAETVATSGIVLRIMHIFLDVFGEPLAVSGEALR